MTNGIFAKKITILFKNGTRRDYTHITEFTVRTLRHGPELYINGESDDEHGMRRVFAAAFAVKDIHMTIIDWYVPPR